MENLLFNNQFNRFQTTYGSDLNQACKNRIFMWVCFSPFRLQTKVIWVGHQFRFLLSEQNLKYDSVTQWFCSLITSNPEWWKNQLNWDLIWPFGHVDVVWIRFVNIAFRVCLLVFFTHSHYEYLNGFEYDTKSDFCCLSEQILKCWFITFRDTPCDAFDNVQVHTTVCNQALSMKAFYLSLL